MNNLNTKKIERHTIQEERFTYDRKRFYQPKDIFYIYGVETITKNFFEKNNIPIDTETIDLVLYDTKVIESSAFINLPIDNITAPRLEKVGNLAFYNCDNLGVLQFSQLKEIGCFSFANCEHLTIVDLPNVEKIGYGAFCNCKYLYNVDIPNVEKLEGLTFASCKNLHRLTAEKLKTYKNNDFLRYPQQTNDLTD